MIMTRIGTVTLPDKFWAAGVKRVVMSGT